MERTARLLYRTAVWSAFRLLVACGGGGSDTSCAASGPYVTPTDTTGQALLYADAECPAVEADGSRQHPLASISGAITAAAAGSLILVAPGTYAESLLIDKAPLSIVGAMVVDTTGDSVIIQPPSHESGAEIVAGAGSAGGTVTLQGLWIRDATVMGIGIEGGDVRVDGCRVEGTRQDDQKRFGFGILARGKAKLTIRASVVAGSASTGILLNDSVATIGGLETGDGNAITDNGLDGIRLEKCTSGEVLVQGNEIAQNREAGVGVFTSKVRIEKNTIRDTQKIDGSEVADGIAVAELVDENQTGQGASHVNVSDNTIENSGRVGILMDAGSGGSVIGNTASKSGKAGIWLQSGAGGTDGDGVVVEKNTLVHNRYIGLGLTNTARALVRNNDVGSSETGTVFNAGQTVEVAYGVGTFNGALATIDSNRFGPLVDGKTGQVLDPASATVAHIFADAASVGTSVVKNALADGATSFTIVVNYTGETSGVTLNLNAGAVEKSFGPNNPSPYMFDKGMMKGIIGPGGGPPESHAVIGPGGGTPE